jgi:hypothetical protein
MKAVAQLTAALLWASATIVTAAATLQRRQDVSNGLPGMWNSPIARAESVKPAAPRHFKDAKRTVVRYGPFTLPARSKDVKKPPYLKKKTRLIVRYRGLEPR